MRVLVVTNPFGGHEKGHRITDSAGIKEILGGEHAHHVVQADHDVQIVEQPVEQAAENPPETTSQEA